MKIKRLFFIPLGLIIITLATALVAFFQNEALDQGYLYVANEQETTVYGGNYEAIFGNLGETAQYILVTEELDDLLITVYDTNETIIREYTLVIQESNQPYDPSIINVRFDTMQDIDTLDDYFFNVSLLENTTYDLLLTKTANNVEEDTIDLVLFTFSGNAYTVKTIMENVSLTTFIMSFISFGLVVVIWYLNKE